LDGDVVIAFFFEELQAGGDDLSSSFIQYHRAPPP
jgi:hypothetical protein